MKVVGLTGPARSGKDTVAQMIIDHYPGEVKRQGFADALKLSAARIFDPEIDLEAAVALCNELKVSGLITATRRWEQGGVTGRETLSQLTGREFLQRFGTEAHRDVFGEDFWLNAVLPADRDDCDLLVIPDVRFENEAARVKNRGRLFLIERPGIAPVEAHASEAGVPGQYLSGVVHNAGNLRALENTVTAMIQGGDFARLP